MSKVLGRKGGHENTPQSKVRQRENQEQAANQPCQPAAAAEPQRYTQQGKPAQPRRREDKPSPGRAYLTEKVSNGDSDKERVAERGQERMENGKWKMENEECISLKSQVSSLKFQLIILHS
jgi:hypothetical protein